MALVTMLDDRDAAIIALRAALLGLRDYPDCGDFIRFDDGTVRRVSYVYGPDWGDMSGVQTSDGGSFYLGEGYVSFSGALHPSVPMPSLTITQEQREGAVWIFHHNFATAHNGVDTTIPFRIWNCTLPATR